MSMPMADAGRVQELRIRPIGWVRNAVTDPRPSGWETVESELHVLPEFAQGLKGLEEFSHIIVLFWLHLVPQELRAAGQLHPGGRTDLPLVGTFATRTQLRPNPLGMAVVPLLGVERAVLRVRGLDAIDGTPLLDLKPHLPPYDAPEQARMPSWVWGDAGSPLRHA